MDLSTYSHPVVVHLGGHMMLVFSPKSEINYPPALVSGDKSRIAVTYLLCDLGQCSSFLICKMVMIMPVPQELVQLRLYKYMYLYLYIYVYIT